MTTGMVLNFIQDDIVDLFDLLRTKGGYGSLAISWSAAPNRRRFSYMEAQHLQAGERADS